MNLKDHGDLSHLRDLRDLRDLGAGKDTGKEEDSDGAAREELEQVKIL